MFLIVRDYPVSDRLMFHSLSPTRPDESVVNRRRTAVIALIPVLLLFFAAIGCVSPLLREADVTSLNDTYRDRVFVTNSDIQATFSTTASDAEPEVIFSRGTRVKIWVESDEDWIRVRATPIEEKREHNPGKVIIYIFRDFLEEDGETEAVQERYPAARLETEIAEILTEVGG